jgi:hypothetical protein
MILIVKMPEAAARDNLALQAELSHLTDEVAYADLVIALWKDDAMIAKDRDGCHRPPVRVRRARSLEMSCGCGHALGRHDDPESSDGNGCRNCNCQAFHRLDEE